MKYHGEPSRLCGKCFFVTKTQSPEEAESEYNIVN